jgi:CheY-like chemotaxis protein
LARKILLADDSVTAQNMGRKILADAGYEVITVNNGSAALKKIGEQRPDLIVLDVYMPGYSGLEVCQRLKEAAETARIPILLTVGKLEPFKTDEAKRVRADGFIVKPFEASELLSALSKLEDKIVPRSENSKPGRFSRATAAIDDSRTDRTVSADDESGWKERIRFPSKKKEAAPEADSGDPSIYNPVNKDLRTTVEHNRPQSPTSAVPEERVDLGALAPDGLPKDVTPEEIAALAAAAAQVQGTVLEAKAEEEREQKQQPSANELKADTPGSMKEPPVAEPVQQDASSATFADPASEKAEPVQEPEVATVASNVIEMPSPAAASKVETSDAPSGNNSWTQAHQPSDEPVTIAAAAGAESGSPARWKAVSVALAPEDNGISLEQEMQQAYAAFASAEAGHSAPSSHDVAAEIKAESSESAPASAVTIPATAAPEAVQSLSSISEAATDAIGTAVKEFETVAAAYVSENTATPVEPQALPVAETASPVEALEPTSFEPVAESTRESLAEIKSESVVSEGLPVAASETATLEASSAVTDGVETESPAVASEPVSKADIARGHSDKKESDISATTAAAWASWRRIRESGDKESQSSPDPGNGASSDDSAAMAVAAGAENTPEEATSNDESDPAIASIVDSVLANLRPKIVEEISRKLGKRK